MRDVGNMGQGSEDLTSSSLAGKHLAKRPLGLPRRMESINMNLRKKGKAVP
jgi:hypothetical protein